MGIEIRNIRRLINKARDMQQLDELRGDVRAAAIRVKREIAEYPPASEANMPNPNKPWYERGWGVRYPSGGGRPVSEDMLHRWTVRPIGGGLGAVISNNASYAPFVHSEERQASFHKRRGWKTDKKVLDELKDDLARRLAVGVRRELAK